MLEFQGAAHATGYSFAVRSIHPDDAAAAQESVENEAAVNVAKGAV